MKRVLAIVLAIAMVFSCMSVFTNTTANIISIIIVDINAIATPFVMFIINLLFFSILNTSLLQLLNYVGYLKHF